MHNCNRSFVCIGQARLEQRRLRDSENMLTQITESGRLPTSRYSAVCKTYDAQPRHSCVSIHQLAPRYFTYLPVSRIAVYRLELTHIQYTYFHREFKNYSKIISTLASYGPREITVHNIYFIFSLFSLSKVF